MPCIYLLLVFAGVACVRITVFSLFCKVAGLRNTHNYNKSTLNYNSNNFFDLRYVPSPGTHLIIQFDIVKLYFCCPITYIYDYHSPILLLTIKCNCNFIILMINLTNISIVCNLTILSTHINIYIVSIRYRKFMQLMRYIPSILFIILHI